MPLDYGIKATKAAFFDSPAVMKALNRFERQALSKFGAFARRRIKSSIKAAPKVNTATGEITRKRKGVDLRDAVSKPGGFPYSHEGSYKRLMLFAYDAQRHSVVVGAARFKKGVAPRLLEHGGTATDRKGRTVHYRPRPVVFPVCREEIKKFPQIVRGGQ